VTIPITVILSVIVQAALQVAGIFMLPFSKGFTNPIPSVLSVVAFGISLYLLARLQHAGYSVSIFIPFLACLVPLMSVVVMVFIMNEPASWPKVGLLMLSCAIVGTAARLA